MALLTGLPTPFCTNSEADTLLTNITSTEFDALDEDGKDAALQWARLYMSRVYKFNFDTDNPPDAIKLANALLAQEHAVSEIFSVAETGLPAKGLTETMVDADGVKTQKKYDASKSRGWVDPFPEITALLLLDGNCYLAKASGGISTVALARR